MFFRSNFQIFPFPLTLILVTISHGELVSEAQQWIYFHVGTLPPWSPPKAARPCFSSTAHPWWSFSSCRLHCHTLHKPPTWTSGSLLYHSIPALPTTAVSSITQKSTIWRHVCSLKYRKCHQVLMELPDYWEVIISPLLSFGVVENWIPHPALGPSVQEE